MRQALEKYQVFIYLTAIGSGLSAGILFKESVDPLERLLWPTLALLLYSTFTQVPLLHLRKAFSEIRFITSAATGNFLLIPGLLWASKHFLPEDPAIRLGVLLVLLVPCTDWFITFTHLGGGDTKQAIAFAPISLLLQMIFLPFYLYLFLGETFTVTVARQEMLVAFGGLIVIPLMGAFLTQKWTEKATAKRGWLGRVGWFPIPLLSLVVFTIAATQVNLVTASYRILGQLLFIFIGFLIAAAVLSRLLARVFGLPSLQGRVLAFSFGTRNSFVVLPLALALPPSYDLAVVTVVFQSLVELLGMGVYLWWVPKKLFPQ
ncbi:MAG: bile acid:sodium symporter [Desulfobacterota bacterium]|nr:bile acid:sodium symporter [Thermodesulfobacteriota bacterium]